jgi:RNA-binding protein
MKTLNPQQRKFLRAEAHDKKPVVMIGNNGLTEAVINETNRALTAHELIKVRVQGDDRAARERWLTELCAATDAVPVQHIGKLLIIYKPAATPRLQLP